MGMVGKLEWTKEEVMGFESFKTAMQNIVKDSNRIRASKTTEQNYLDGLRQYLKFVNSEEALSKTVNPDNLIVEAHSDMEGTKDKIRLFFLWLQNEKVPGYKQRGKKVKKTSAYVRAYAQIRGFYTNNGVIFGKWKTPSLADMKKEAIENDITTPFFKLDKKRKIFLDRSLVKQFLANLKFRDQTIFLVTLSSSHDSGDVLSLNVGDIRKQKDRERFFWEGQRGKSEVRFKTFFSLEATDFVRRYLEQERQGADDKEPLFLTSTYKGKQRRMNSKQLAYVFLDAAKRMGVKLEKGYQNPFRSKRLRHIFRTACTHAHVDEGYINAFMGHKTSVSKGYLEKDLAFLELEYSKAEPFLTVYGVGGTEGLETIQTELAEWKGKYADLKVKVDDLETQYDVLQKKVKVWDRAIQKITALSIKEFVELEEDLPKEEIKPKEKISTKISKIDEPKEEKDIFKLLTEAPAQTKRKEVK